MGKLASVLVYTWRRIRFDPFSRIRSVEDLAEISLARGAVLNGSSELGWVRTGLIVLKTWSWSPCGAVFGSSNTVLLRVGNCLISFLGSFAELFNSSTVVWYKIKLLSDLSSSSSSGRLIA